MRIMLDTNVLISAALFPDGMAYRAYRKALLPPYEPLVCDYVVDELKRKFREKFPAKLQAAETFLYYALSVIRVVPTPEERRSEENKIRDPKDRPILRAALDAHADLFLTGDKDFLESSVTDPRIISVSEFLENYPESAV